MQAEHGQVLVVAASHLIFRLRHASQALVTNELLASAQHALKHTLQSFVTVVLVDEDII